MKIIFLLVTLLVAYNSFSQGHSKCWERRKEYTVCVHERGTEKCIATRLNNGTWIVKNSKGALDVFVETFHKELIPGTELDSNLAKVSSKFGNSEIAYIKANNKWANKYPKKALESLYILIGKRRAYHEHGPSMLIVDEYGVGYFLK